MNGRRLRVLNPNRSTTMTERVVARLRGLAPAGWTVEGRTAADGPAVIRDRQTFADGAAAARHLMAADPSPCDGVLLACFGDPGLEALRDGWPQVQIEGLAHAAGREAASVCRRFSIVTCGADWVSLLQERFDAWGLRAWLGEVIALPVDGATFAGDPARWRGCLRAAADQACRSGSQRLLLGGAAFAGHETLVDWPLPVLDPIAAAARRLFA